MIREKSNLGKIFISLLILMCLLCTFSFISVPGQVLAEGENETEYTSALEDLEKDENFNASRYPAISIDYSLDVIQIAESEENELFIYVYNPSSEVKELRATSINISISANEGLYVADDDEGMSYINYKLTFLNKDGVFYKYKVDNFTIKNDETRYYNISNIYRAFDYTLDEPLEDQEISEVGNRVGKVWTAQTIDGEVQYTCKEVETIEITSKYVGFIRYYNGWKFYDSSCYSQYIAFSTDKPIDKLIEAEVFYVQTSIMETSALGIPVESIETLPEDKYTFLNYTQKASNSPGGLFSNSYTWDRIETVEDFKSGLEDDDINLTDEAEAGLEDKKWVLRFTETDYQVISGIGGMTTRYYTRVTEVSILRLKFETDGEVYSLGVIDNKQTGSLQPSNENDPWWKFLVEILIWIVGGLLGIVVLLFAIVGFIKFAGWLLKQPFNLLKKKKWGGKWINH